MLLLCGCRSVESDLDTALSLRENLSGGCAFSAEVTADYGDSVYTFELDCRSNADGSLNFTVVSPETISGISGKLSATGGQLQFDESVLAFPMLVEGEVSPVSAPWLMLHSLQGGYIRGCGKDGDQLKMMIDDSYAQEPLQVELWLDAAANPQTCEIMWQNRRILSLKIKSFSFL